MRKVIDGKIYDTDTAEEVATYSNGRSKSDLNFCFETLYLTTKRNWFLYGQGGANSQYAVSEGNSQLAGDMIVPLNEDKARSFVERNSSVEMFGKYWMAEEA